MRKGEREGLSENLLLYYKTKEDVEAYLNKPVKLKLQWLQAQMEFFYRAMPPKAKRVREKFRRGEV